MITRDRSSWWRVRVAGKRTETLPCRQHICPTDLQIICQVLFCFIQKPTNFHFWRSRITDSRPFAVCSTDQCVPLPGQEEQEASIRSIDIQEPNSIWTVVARKNNVCSSSSVYSRFTLWFFHFSHVISERPPTEDDGFGFDFKFLARSIISTTDTICFAVVVCKDAHHFRVVGDTGSFFGCSECDTGSSPCVVVLSFVKHLNILDVFIQLRKFTSCPFVKHEMRRWAGKS
mmetsp:Transcript_22730/g.39946  ORF Transcript_22730/g.39946 Transcript_22730/m.39946 type:complete len:230 (+) Transcript_22730:1309-1998(+)